VSLPIARTLLALVVAASLIVLFAPGDDVPSGFPYSDKFVHAGLFAVLAGTGLVARLPLLRLTVGLVAYAAVSEWLQGVLPIDRDADLTDFVADCVGIALGLLAARALDRTLAARRS
jgi:hypothetical protein